MKAELQERVMRFYASEDEIKKDQEAIVRGIFDRHPDFVYLRENAELSDRVRKECLEGIRDGIARFMKAKGIKDVRDVFERDAFTYFFYDNDKCTALKNRLTSDPILRSRLYGTEEDSVYECEHIAEEVASIYVNEVNRKKLVFSKIILPAELDYIDMPEIKGELDN